MPSTSARKYLIENRRPGQDLAELKSLCPTMFSVWIENIDWSIRTSSTALFHCGGGGGYRSKFPTRQIPSA